MAILATEVDVGDETGILAHVEAIRLILEEDIDEYAMAEKLRDYCRESLTEIEDMALVYDKLAACKVISKAKFRELWNTRL